MKEKLGDAGKDHKCSANQATKFPTHRALAGMCGFQKQISIKTFYHLIKVVKTF